MDQYKESYTEEAHELIVEMEKSLLQLEHDPGDQALIQQVFRAMHTLKGNSAMFGLKVIAEFTHHLESIYEFIRSGQQQITREILNVTLASLDHLSVLIDNQNLSGESKQRHEHLTAQVVAIVNGIQCVAVTPHSFESTTEIENAADDLTTYQIYFCPDREIFYNGTNPLYLLEELITLGDCKITADTSAVPSLEFFDATLCYTSWTIELKTSVKEEQIREVFIFVEDRCKLEISAVKSQELSIDATLITSVSTINQTENKSPVAENPISITPTDVAKSNKKNVVSSIRVPSERLDNLMSLVSELMTLQAKLGTLTEQNPQTELQAVNESLEKISTRLRDNAFSMCLVPINTMLTPFNRLVRDLATELNKQIEFVTEGAETELDKNIMEGLSDPLMHLLRNSIDHGIEDPEMRISSGKAKHGTILFKAYCSGTNVFIEIQDDGKGIDPEKIRAKAIQKGIISKDDVLNEKEIFNLIFLPGFSTAEKISEISGRGVGMDVVKRKIADIRGQIKISSQLNVGTTITIKLPLTVSIIDGFLIKVNQADFVIPLSSVDRCFELSSIGQLNRFNNVIVLDGEQIPFISLSEEFDGLENFSNNQEIVLVYHEERKVALIVDRVVGKFQAVLKPLGRYFLHMDNISGATILGDGKIALVLDTNKVIEQYSDTKRFSICQ